MLILAGTTTFGMFMWFYSSKQALGTQEFVLLGLVLTVVAFSLYIAYNRYKNEKQGLPADDELSNRIKQKAGAGAFMYSFYMWLLIYFLFRESELEIIVPIGLGIIGMGAVFLVLYLYYSFSGVEDENEN